MNTCKGRNDRFYCKYIDFTEDNIENRILKATLLKCKEIVGRRFPATSEVSKRVAYCMNSFHRVQTVRIKTSDFNGADASGLYMYYKPLLQQARCIYGQKYYAYKNEEGQSVAKSVFTIPYIDSNHQWIKEALYLKYPESYDAVCEWLLDYGVEL